MKQQETEVIEINLNFKIIIYQDFTKLMIKTIFRF